MNNLTITLQIPGLAEAITRLAEALNAGQAPKALTVSTHIPAQAQPAQPAVPSAIPTAPVSVPAQAPPAPTQNIPAHQLPYGVAGGVQAYMDQINAQKQPAPVRQPIPTAQAPEYTLEDFQTAVAPLMDADRGQDLTNLLRSFGVQSLMELPKEQYGAFATALRALGAQI